MDEVQIVTQTLNNVLQRHAKQTANYEIEITNLTAEVIKLQNEVATLKNYLSQYEVKTEDS